jgi:hypothetical protein
MPKRTSLLFACAFSAFCITAAAQESEQRGPTLVLPADGAVVDRQVTVRIGFSGRSPQGPAEGTGIEWNRTPHDWSAGNRPGNGPSDDSGISSGHHQRGPHYAMLIDTPMPEPGTPFHIDSQHVAFPVGVPQMTLTLSPGQHQLTLVRLNDQGAVSRRFLNSETTTIIVKN